jgi:hypothetical protein
MEENKRKPAHKVFIEDLKKTIDGLMISSTTSPSAREYHKSLFKDFKKICLYLNRIVIPAKELNKIKEELTVIKSTFEKLLERSNFYHSNELVNALETTIKSLEDK